MDIVQYRRELEFQKAHMTALRTVKSLTNTAPPSSLKYKHLNIRAKQQQMAEDRKFEISLENKKLMVKMTEIFLHPKKVSQSNNERNKSNVSEIYKKHEIQKINRENNQIFNRLHSIAPILKKSEFENDFKKHKQFRTLIQKKPSRVLLSPLKSVKPSMKPESKNINAKNEYFGISPQKPVIYAPVQSLGDLSIKRVLTPIRTPVDSSDALSGPFRFTQTPVVPGSVVRSDSSVRSKQHDHGSNQNQSRENESLNSLDDEPREENLFGEIGITNNVE